MNHAHRTILIILALAGLNSVRVFGQLPAYYTQYLSNEFVINPAYAGAEDALSVSLIHRSQWISVEGMPVTQSLTGHSLIKNKNTGVGVLLTHDKIGVHRSLTALGAYSFRINLDRKRYLALGLQAGIRHQKSDYGSLSGQVQNPLDPKLSIGDSPFNAFVFGSGLYYSGPRLKIGLSAPDMLSTRRRLNDTVSVDLSRSYYFSNLAYTIPVSGNVDLLPGLLVKYRPDLPVSCDLNMQAVFNDALTAAVSVRIKSSVSFILQAQINPQFSVGYAYDYPTGKLAEFNLATHEFMIRYLFEFLKSNVKRPR